MASMIGAFFGKAVNTDEIFGRLKYVDFIFYLEQKSDDAFILELKNSHCNGMHLTQKFKRRITILKNLPYYISSEVVGQIFHSSGFSVSIDCLCQRMLPSAVAARQESCRIDITHCRTGKSH